MSQSSSSEFQLEIKSEHFEDIALPQFPVTSKIHKDALKRKLRIKKVFYLHLYEQVNLHSHLLQLISVVLTCFYYSLMLRTIEDYLKAKCFHSMSLGIICLVDYIINKEQLSVSGIDRKTVYYLERMLPEAEESSSQRNCIDEDELISFEKFLLYSIFLGLANFSSELLIYFLLKFASISKGYNGSIGFCLLSFEVILMRLYFSFNDVKIEFPNFIGIVLIFSLFLIFSVGFLSVGFGFLAVVICVIRFLRDYLLIELRTLKNVTRENFIFHSKLVDFCIGCLMCLILILSVKKQVEFLFSDFLIMFVASACNYVNLKYFIDYDK